MWCRVVVPVTLLLFHVIKTDRVRRKKILFQYRLDREYVLCDLQVIDIAFFGNSQPFEIRHCKISIEYACKHSLAYVNEYRISPDGP